MFSNSSNSLNINFEYQSHYYPYGKILRQYSNGVVEKFLTTQHERDLETGLDYRGARFYDSDVARFLSLDPAANRYTSISAYNYVLGNPIALLDPDCTDLIDPGRFAFYIRMGAASIEAVWTLQKV